MKTNFMHRFTLSTVVLTISVWCNSGFAVEYSKDISPLLRRSCVACHNSKKPEGGLNLETAALLLKGGDSGQAVVANKSAESEILKRIMATDDTAMPPKDNSAGAKRFTQAEIDLIKQWIDAGAIPGDDGAPKAISWQPVSAAIRPIYAVDTSVDGQFIACGRGNNVVIYSWPMQASAASAIALVDPQTTGSVGLPAAHFDLVQSVAFSPDAQLLATGGYRCVKLWRRDATPSALVGLKNAAGVIVGSHNDKWLAIAREDRSIDILDPITRQTKQTIPALATPVAKLSWSLDDKFLFVADQSNTVSRWQLPALDGAAGQPTALNFGAGASIIDLVPLAQDRVALLLADGQVAQWAIEAAPAPAAAAAPAAANPAQSSTPLAFVKKEFPQPLISANSISLSPGEPGVLIVAQADGQVRTVHAIEGKVMANWKSPVGIAKVASNPRGGTVAALGSDGSMRIWNVTDGKEVLATTPETAITRIAAQGQRTVARQQGEVDRLAASIKDLEAAHKKEEEAMKKVADEREKAATALTAKITECDANVAAIKESEKGIEATKAMIAEQMKKIEQLTADIEAKKKKDTELATQRQTAMDNVKKQEQALASSKDAVERAAKAIPAQQEVVEKGKLQLTAYQATAAELAEKAKQSLAEASVAFAYNNSGSSLIVGRKGGTITVLDVAAGRVASELKSSNQLSGVVATSNSILAANATAPLTAWSSEATWKLERVLGSETDPLSLFSDRVTAIAFSPDGQSLAVGSGPASRFGDVKLFRVSDGSMVKDFGEVHSDTVLDLAFSPDGKELASCAADKLVRVFDLATGKQRLSLEGHTHHVLSVAWQDSGRVLATASADGTVKIWDKITGEQQRTVSGFSKEITSLSFVGQTSQFLAACADNSLRLVEANDGKTVRSFAGATSALYALCVTADGKQVVAGGQDGKLGIWTIENAQVVKQLD